jgi:pimeloyl-ACP methyl ester carboxylesterase
MDRPDLAPRLEYLTVPGPAAKGGGARRMAWWDWAGDPNHIVICVHGLSRQGRDFDALARRLAPSARVVAVDVAGRGYSDWLADPMAYQLGTYAADLGALIAHLRQTAPDARIDWVGTSMGGLIGMALAAQPASGIARLVLNDVGPAMRWEALQRIAGYVGADPSFATEQEAVAYLASLSTGFGPHTPEQWLALSRPMLRQRRGRWVLHYDPAIAEPLRALVAHADEAAARAALAEGEAAMWALYDRIGAPTLLLRGAESDLLTRETAQEMGRRGPRARCIEFAGVGHAPTLVAEDQKAAVADFLLAPAVGER